MTYELIISQVALELNLSIPLVKETYKAYWQYIKNTIQLLPLKLDLKKLLFDKLRTSFNIPSLGKIYCTIDKYEGVKRKFQYIKKIRERND